VVNPSPQGMTKKQVTINDVSIDLSSIKHLLDTATLLSFRFTIEDYITIIQADPETYHELPEDIKRNPEIELAYKLL
jgi:hypothetical protein